jgi:hypothetical protein
VALGRILTLGLGSAAYSAVKYILTLGLGTSAVTPPTTEGIEFRIAAAPLHWRIDAKRLHWKTEED